MARVGALVAVVAGGGVAALALVGRYLAGRLAAEALDVAPPPTRDLVVVAVSDGEVVLRGRTPRPHPDLRTNGRFGLEWEDGYGEAGEILADDGREVRRAFRLCRGELRPGTVARLDSFAFAGDPQTAHRLPFEDVVVQSPAGPLPAWHVPAESRRWAIMVHGKGAGRREFLRILPAVHAAGLHALVISYCNDEACPATPDGRHAYGEHEWRDLEAAAWWALGQGAEEIVLVGFSMGGAIALAFLARSALADRVTALVMDSPLLDFRATVRANARRRGIPGAVVALGAFAAERRYRFRFAARSYLAIARELAIPMLVYHGAADRLVPIETSDQLAAERLGRLTYVRTGAGHVRSWNIAPAAYEEALMRFLGESARRGS